MSSKPATDRSRGDGDAALGGRVEHAEGEQVGEREDRGRAVGAVEQLGAGGAAEVPAVADRRRRRGPSSHSMPAASIAARQPASRAASTK